ncbi:MAG: transcriptional regulator [Firmicutes bacterium]|nr:transcriptional regulator [Bacillota bacterium]
MEELELLSEVARLYYENNMTQNEIAKHIHTSRSTVSRLLQEAREKKVVEIHIHYPWDRSPVLEHQLLTKFGLKDIRILEAQNRRGEETLRGVALLAARYIDSVIKEDSILGISWGKALHNTVEALNPNRKIPIKVVQLFGAAIPNSQTDGFNVVRKTAAIYGGKCYYIHAPLFVGSSEARDVLIENPHIKETLRIAEEADIIVTGIGSLEPTVSPSQTWLSYLSKEAIEQLKRKGAAGHICAHHYDIMGNVLPLKLHAGIVGVGIELLKKVPVVIGIASGTEKARAIIGALNGKLINTLITDDRTAEKILELSSESFNI